MTSLGITLHDWQNFYVMIGAASATLIGLMFIAMSLGTSQMAITYANNIQVFVQPTITHFIAALFISAIMLVPTHSPLSLGGSLLVAGVVALLYLLTIIWKIWTHARREMMHDQNWLWYVILPFAAYMSLLGSGLWLQTETSSALDVVAAAAMLLMFIGIRNAWELTLWIITNRT